MVSRTTDTDAVETIMNHPKVFRMLGDDGSLSSYIARDTDFYIINDSFTGVIRLDPLNSIACLIHIATTPELWGRAYEFALDAINWGFTYTNYSKVVGLIPEFNKLTIKLGIKCGFKIEGLLKKSFIKDWKHHNQVVLGLTKTDFYKENIQWDQH